MNAATALPLDRAEARPGSLRLRIVSALVMAPVALVAVALGGRPLSALVALAAAGMGWEWGRLSGRGRFGATGVIVVVTSVVACAILAFGDDLGIGADFRIASLVALAGSVAVLAVAVLTRRAEPVWAAAGTLWIALGAAAFLWLALAAGRGWLLSLLGIVWATDIGAYIAGRGIGGPKLAPRLSPNKTWAGLAGGVAGAMAVGAIAGSLGGAPAGVGAIVGACLAVIAQLGDLAESLAKRHFGVKDASNLIPGHGGLLDRLDGLLAASIAGALLFMAMGFHGFPGWWR